MDAFLILIIAGAVGLVVAVVGFGFTLWTKDRRTIAIGISLLGIAILLFASHWQDNHVGRDMLYFDITQREELTRKLEALNLLLKLFLER